MVDEKKKKIAAGLVLGFVDAPVEWLVKADWNYKTDSEEKSAKLRENFKRNGQIENIIIRQLDTGFYEVVNGNHRYDVMVELGLTNCHAYNLGIISEAQAKRIAIETNETRFASDNVKLAEALDELVQEFSLEGLAETLPWSETEIENMQKMLNYDWDQFSEDDDGGEGGMSEDDGKKVTFFITVDISEDMIEQELQEVCDKYKSARMKSK